MEHIVFHGAGFICGTPTNHLVPVTFQTVAQCLQWQRIYLTADLWKRFGCVLLPVGENVSHGG